MSDPIREAAEGVLFWVGPQMSNEMRNALIALRAALDANSPKGVCTECTYLDDGNVLGVQCVRLGFYFRVGSTKSDIDPSTFSCAEWKAKEEQ